MTKDKCEICKGERGGVPGNENIIEGKAVCDYCSVDIWRAEQGLMKRRNEMRDYVRALMPENSDQLVDNITDLMMHRQAKQGSWRDRLEEIAASRTKPFTGAREP